MGNKTLIPAFKARVGDWNYYICHMKYAEVARQVQFAYELGGNKELSTMIQRGISSRTDDIVKYLLNSEHRFLGALIVAAWGGEPEYLPVEIADNDGLVAGLDRQFGVLTFDGTQQYFALDGQHRLRAIKEALMKDQSLGSEDICVLMVAHQNTEEGRQRTRRLFTNINRNAKVTTGAENIVLDEDDGVAIITRRMLTEHPFLSDKDRVKVIGKHGDTGEMSLVGNSIPRTDKRAWTSIRVLYDCLTILCSDLHPSMRNPSARPDNDVLDTSYDILVKRVDGLLEKCGSVRSKLEEATSARDLRAPTDPDKIGHPFMRPVIQKAVCRVVADVVASGRLSWDEALEKLAGLSWQIDKAPWTSVYAVDSKNMFSAKEFSELLDKALLAHISPPSKSFVKDFRRQYNDLRNERYPITEADLLENIALPD